MLADELMHTIKQLVAQALVDQRPFVYGHISSYDPNGHRVKCIIPSMTDENGVPLLSPWMPMGSLSAGAGYGVQVIYQGGATAQNPTGGEQVLVGLFDRARGVSAVPALFFNNENQPPATNLPSGASPAVPGDVLISNPSGRSCGCTPMATLSISGPARRSSPRASHRHHAGHRLRDIARRRLCDHARQRHGQCDRQRHHRRSRHPAVQGDRRHAASPLHAGAFNLGRRAHAPRQ